ncbi:MAG TPA: helix-turn-helix domain-containing protein [Candidatus Limnocylindrales bacterium]
MPHASPDSGSSQASSAPAATSMSAASPSPAAPASASPLGAALERVGDRWSLLLVEALLDGSRRFNELIERLPGLAPNILSERLRRLEREGVVVARPYQRRPIRMEYDLTADGRDLASAVRLLADWGSRRAPSGRDAHEPLRHLTCGTPLEARWYCPTCAVSVSESEAPDTRTV